MTTARTNRLCLRPITLAARWVIAVVLATVWLATGAAQQPPTGAGAPARPEDRMEPLPRELEGVALEQKLGAQVPLETRFKDEFGNDRTLGDYFDGKRPVIITLNYFR